MVLLVRPTSAASLLWISITLVFSLPYNAPSNITVSVSEIMESERKLRVSSLLRLHSKQFGKIEIKNYLLEFRVCDSNDKVLVDNSFVGDVLLKSGNLAELPRDEVVTLAYVAGYIAKKGIDALHCTNCRSSLVEHNSQEPLHAQFHEEIKQHFLMINRGGLRFPSPLLLVIVQIAYQLFTFLVSSEFESRFFALAGQKSNFVALNMAYWEEYEVLTEELCSVCPVCDVPMKTLLSRAVTTMSNVLLNNYTKFVTDKEEREKLKRKGNQTSTTSGSGARKLKKFG